MDIDTVTLEEYARAIVCDYGPAVDDETQGIERYDRIEAVEDICGIVEDLRHIIARVDKRPTK